MAKAEKPKKRQRLSNKAQYERFRETARKLGVDNKMGVEAFEQAFDKIVPSKQPQKDGQKSGS